ncbi:MAG: ATP synthase F1 subunit gamma [Clostridiales bacterium]|nr:ATP synthase F1 subunit gamma [Clostridiales bacterium]
MASLRDLRRRIRSVRNIQQITRAMKMVAAARLRGAQHRAEAARPYAEALTQALEDLSASGAPLEHPFFQRRPLRRRLLVVVSSDRGLAGPYNANILRLAQQKLREEGGTESPWILAVGRKADTFFRRRGYHLVGSLVDLGDRPSVAHARQLADRVMELYLAGEVDEVWLLFNQFVTPAIHRPRALLLLPLQKPEGEKKEKGTPGPEISFEPDGATVLGALLPHFLVSSLYRSLLEAKASEHGARMTAMDNASKNAGELIDRLTLLANRLRQEAITKEIAEIVGGAEALKGVQG